ncbi:MAG: riboflavin synthase [Bacillota bacterium]|nr:riboflavin synthase [Bacillota bacterium]
MFTGLIEEMGMIRRISSTAEGTDLVIEAKKVLSDLKIGDSIAVSGPCLTATSVAKDSFTAWAMPETIKRTNLGSLAAGHKVNLERAMAMGDRLGGHLVSGHIDFVVTLKSRRLQGGAIILSFDAPTELLRYVVPKGSVALDGISLTVVEVEKSSFSVGVIPHTASHTTLGFKDIGSPINLEVDLIGKYVEKMLAPRLEGGGKEQNKITIAMLAEKGYL